MSQATATKSTFKSRASVARADEFLLRAVKFTQDRLRDRKQESAAAFGDWEEWRERGRQIRTHTVAHLDYYLDQFVTNMEAHGGQVHFANDSAEATKIALEIAQKRGAKLVGKSKSMVSEEVHLNHVFEEHGIECLETDLGEWIVQLAHEMPSHIIVPAIHKNREQIKDLFEAEGGETLTTETRVLANYARRALRERFQQADIGMTGCNFAIAESGTIVMFTNEGNGRMVTTLPKTHIVMMGMERVLPTWDDLEVMVNLLPRSATGQKITVYVTGTSGPRRQGEIDGPEETHIIILDNGRSEVLASDEFRDALNCIRCGACLNVCPVYRHVGGHTYGGPYSGPIGAVITPLLNPGKPEWGELAYASSLCGACSEACPVKIPLHDMLVHLRRRYVAAGFAPPTEQAAFSGFGKAFSSPGMYQAAGKMGRWMQLKMIGDGSKKSFLTNMPTPLQGWIDHRTLPPPNKKAFRDLWPELAKERPEKPKGGAK
jgi:L-lactate dehydrogenase complex protein LldF